MANSDRFHPEYIRLIEYLVKERRVRNLTQADIAMLIGTTQSIVSKYERKEVLMDVLDFVRYCLALEISPTDVLSSLGWTLQELKRSRSAHL